MSRASHRDTCKSDDIRVNENSKLKSEIYECEDYMYREKRSAKLDRVLASLKEHVSQKKTEHARNITFFSQSSNDLIASISFFLSCSFHWAFQAHFIRRFKPISSYHMSLKQTHFWFRSITFDKALFRSCHCSRLTSNVVQAD